MRSVLLLLAVAALASCSTPLAPSPPPLPNLAPPRLLSPAPDAVVEQNVASTGCAFDPRAGYGLRVDFSWEPDPAARGVSRYHLVFQNARASLPATDMMVEGFAFSRIRCGSFVADANTTGWEWRVRAVGADGAFGDWSETRTLTYMVCRIDGTYCG